MERLMVAEQRLTPTLHYSVMVGALYQYLNSTYRVSTPMATPMLCQILPCVFKSPCSLSGCQSFHVVLPFCRCLSVFAVLVMNIECLPLTILDLLASLGLTLGLELCLIYEP